MNENHYQALLKRVEALEAQVAVLMRDRAVTQPIGPIPLPWPGCDPKDVRPLSPITCGGGR